MWHKGTVLQGNKEGRTIGFPTVNLSPTLFSQDTKQGVYACTVKLKGLLYPGALYFGPRLVKHEKHTVLEIHILGFEDEIYGEEIEFEVGAFIRGVMAFASFKELEERIRQDILEIKSILQSQS
jgi:riboflavin kinase/FMN adenylyltransferase